MAASAIDLIGTTSSAADDYAHTHKQASKQASNHPTLPTDPHPHTQTARAQLEVGWDGDTVFNDCPYFWNINPSGLGSSFRKSSLFVGQEFLGVPHPEGFLLEK